jgi:hypothetical protein
VEAPKPIPTPETKAVAKEQVFSRIEQEELELALKVS